LPYAFGLLMRPNLERIGTIIIHATTTTAPCVVLAVDLSSTQP
jgi:hypothetical protein